MRTEELVPSKSARGVRILMILDSVIPDRRKALRKKNLSTVGDVLNL